MCRRCPPTFELQVDGQVVAGVDWWKTTIDEHLPFRKVFTDFARSYFRPGRFFVTRRLPPEESKTVKLYRNEKGEVVRTDYFNEKGERVMIEEVLDIDFQALKDLLPKDSKP